MDTILSNSKRANKLLTELFELSRIDVGIPLKTGKEPILQAVRRYAPSLCRSSSMKASNMNLIFPKKSVYVMPGFRSNSSRVILNLRTMNAG